MRFTYTVPYHQYELPPVCETEEARLYWNRKIQTDRPIPNSIPDLVMIFKKKTSRSCSWAWPTVNTYFIASEAFPHGIMPYDRCERKRK